MHVLRDIQFEKPHECPYIPGNTARNESFLAYDVTLEEMALLLSSGWRKFGVYFFRPRCLKCAMCEPIRVPARAFKPSRRHLRLLKKPGKVRVRFVKREFREEIFEIYTEHSRDRFGREAEREDFLHSFYLPSCPGIQSEYSFCGELGAAGFIDCASNGFSSVYFSFRTRFNSFSPGIFSILKEIEYTAIMGMEYYYLGYFVERCPQMAYKAGFFPHERMDWKTEKWVQRD